MNDVRIERKLNMFEKYLYVWILLCIALGIIIGKVVPNTAKFLDGLQLYPSQLLFAFFL